MRNSLFTLVLLFSFGFTKAGGVYTNDALFQKLAYVNAEWNKQPEAKQLTATTQITGNTTFNQWIATHLMLVEQTLRNRDISGLSAQQKQNRLNLLNELHGYWQAGTFPINDYLSYKNPVFIDRRGTHCAVGYLMMQSGHDDLAQAIDRNEKFAYVHQIKTGGVKEWADTHGFTIDELAWIQPGYPSTTPTFDLDSGLNGTVNVITPDPTNQIVYVGGNFSASYSGAACNNVAAWISGFAGWDWIPVGGGLNGPVHTLVLQNSKLYAGGEFTMAGNVAVNHIAVYDITLGQWQAIGSLDSTVRSLAFYNGDLYAGGDFTGFVSKWNGNQWSSITNGFIYGEGVRTLEVFDNKLVIGGNFELATGALRKHVAAWDGTGMGALGMGTLTPVNDLAVYNNTLVAACDVISGTDTCAIAAYENSDWVVKLRGANDIMVYFQGVAVKSLLSVNNRLFAGGDFECSAGMTIGSDIMELSKTPSGMGDTSLYMCNPLTFTNSGIKALAELGNSLYFGGTFTTSSTNTTNHIAYLQLTPTGVEEVPGEAVSVNVFPNPASNSITFNGGSASILQAEIIDITGRKVLAESINASVKSISVAQLPAGVYTVRASTKTGWASARLVKE